MNLFQFAVAAAKREWIPRPMKTLAARGAQHADRPWTPALDPNVTFRENAIALALGRQLYEQRAEFYELNVPHWHEVDRHTRGLYVERAYGILRELE